MTFLQHAWKPFSIAALLLTAACGGSDSGNDAPPVTVPPEKAVQVSVIGDSLSDVGVFGLRYTVQADTLAAPFALWPELVADAQGAERPCAAYQASTDTHFTPQPGCRAHAVAGGRIQHPLHPSPLSIVVQLQDLAAHVGADGFGERDVILIDGGGNDAADLITAYFQAYITLLTQLDITPYRDFLAHQLGQDKANELLAQPSGWEQAGEAYMQALAQNFAAQIDTHVLTHGAKRVVILNMPDVTLTPKLQNILKLLQNLSTSQNTGVNPGVQGQGLADQFQVLFQRWAQAFNRTLGETFQGSEKVVIVDFYGQLTQWASKGSDFGLSNTTHAVCPVQDATAVLPDYDISQCTITWLDAHPPAGVSPQTGWWQSYAFADGFHPSPRGHTLMTQAVNDAIAAKGWK